MRVPPPPELEMLWASHNSAWRDPAQVASQWLDATATDPQLLRHSVRGAWWEALAHRPITLLVTREYEHLIIAMCATGRGPAVSFMPMPHPSGVAVDHQRGTVHVASTRNPNIMFYLAPVQGVLPRRDVYREPVEGHPLVPVRSRYFPGCLYLHDLGFIWADLHANSVG